MKAIYLPLYVFTFIKLSSPAEALDNLESAHWTPRQKYCHDTCTRKYCGKDNWDTCFKKCYLTDTISLIPHCINAALKAEYITKKQCNDLQEIPMYEDLKCESY